MCNAIKAVIATLETIPVSGKNNLDKLLGCILTLEAIVNERAVAENDGNGERENS